MPSDKYRIFEVFEIEDGWILKRHIPLDPTQVNQPDYETFFFKNIKSLAERLIEFGGR
jgi:hypothetical protein